MTATRDSAREIARSARGVAAAALGRAGESFPRLDPAPLDASGLDARDARLALAIHRTAIQRWITLEHIINGFLRQPMNAIEPSLRGLFLCAAAQLLFMDRLPAHAVVDESVALSRVLVRPGAAGLVNAVLRRVAGLRKPSVAGEAWTPAADRLPLEEGYVPLAQATLPAPGVSPAALSEHLALATSNPVPLVASWIARFGAAEATALALHGIITPPTIVAVEPGFDAAAQDNAACAPHARAGFVVWTGDHDGLVAFLAANVARRVQDPASSLAVASTAALSPKLILDYCAGRGTKTRQLALLHPSAQIVATDLDERRVGPLRTSLTPFANATGCLIESLGRTLAGRRADLLLLDVPCSNTAVLARRPEARYRFNPESLASLATLQRTIIGDSAALLAPQAHVLYSTCSLDEQENQAQARWAATHLKGELLAEHLELPQGRGTSYQDGSYHALIRVG
ncbi:MAG: hypothetical protein NTW19_10575 [Planctomycetota bacterium]|nr:hypothetical protein [Planctomycetota bacterium]